MVDAPPDDCASTAPGHDPAPVRRRQITQEDRFLTAVERLASPTPQLIAAPVVEPEHVNAIGSDRATDGALLSIGDLAQLRRSRQCVERVHLESPARVCEQHTAVPVLGSPSRGCTRR